MGSPLPLNVSPKDDPGAHLDRSHRKESRSGMCFVQGLGRDTRERDPKFLFFNFHPSPDHAQSFVLIIEEKCKMSVSLLEFYAVLEATHVRGH